MNSYDVDFSYSKIDTPDTFDTQMVMYSVLGVPDSLVGKRMVDHIAAELQRRIPDIAKIRGLRIRG